MQLLSSKLLKVTISFYAVLLFSLSLCSIFGVGWSIRLHQVCASFNEWQTLYSYYWCRQDVWPRQERQVFVKLCYLSYSGPSCSKGGLHYPSDKSLSVELFNRVWYKYRSIGFIVIYPLHSTIHWINHFVIQLGHCVCSAVLTGQKTYWFLVPVHSHKLSWVIVSVKSCLPTSHVGLLRW